ncbi:tyrosine-type recombinase/integrase [Sphingobacterium sp. DK4209]|uniref:Tyrosine recombinase XerC n=1 Tax=Sphingobacterium zhuxiongii TaxID=2662364 RepID=A0A5Q0Q9H4_9SPHI|nr:MULTISPECIES: tyrosine-type recombinase/integrase [unclassified Sphingobacterium]MVZ65128.1 tyrosine-type recombinase/integrase [Sphingobacterium sp. DK4209]QGA26076.1 tyrosine-type recombinase/integrase [Sphingobacterium sp. dk4302]
MYKDNFITYLRFEKHYSVHTLSAYEKEIDQFLSFAEQESYTFDAIDFKFLRYYFSTLRESGKEVRSVNRAISALKSFYKFLMREGLCSKNPMSLIKSLKVPQKLPTIVEKDKLVQLLDNLEQELETFEDIRDFIVLELLFGTGIRVSELIKIKEIDVDFYNKKILILGKRSKERFVPINNTLLEELKRYLLEKKQQNFQNIIPELVVTKEGKPAYRELIYKIVKKYLSMITSQKKRSPHVLRHTFATALLDNGADLNAIKELLGHAGLSATQVYTHNSAERLKSIYKQAHPKA